MDLSVVGIIAEDIAYVQTSVSEYGTIACCNNQYSKTTLVCIDFLKIVPIKSTVFWTVLNTHYLERSLVIA